MTQQTVGTKLHGICQELCRIPSEEYQNADKPAYVSNAAEVGRCTIMDLLLQRKIELIKGYKAKQTLTHVLWSAGINYLALIYHYFFHFV